eukprot:scaffold8847_cov112-Isochrysis_galbana.AAC.4
MARTRAPSFAQLCGESASRRQAAHGVAYTCIDPKASASGALPPARKDESSAGGTQPAGAHGEARDERRRHGVGSVAAILSTSACGQTAGGRIACAVTVGRSTSHRVALARIGEQGELPLDPFDALDQIFALGDAHLARQTAADAMRALRRQPADHVLRVATRMVQLRVMFARHLRLACIGGTVDATISVAGRPRGRRAVGRKPHVRDGQAEGAKVAKAEDDRADQDQVGGVGGDQGRHGVEHVVAVCFVKVGHTAMKEGLSWGGANLRLRGGKRWGYVGM